MKPLILLMALLSWMEAAALSLSLSLSTALCPLCPAGIHSLSSFSKKKKNLFVSCMCSLEIALGIELNPGQVIRVDVHGAWVQALLEEGHDR